MNKLVYDIETMASLLAACVSANAELAKAQSLVNEIKSHQDWTCKEKDQIDDLMEEIKNLVNAISTDSEGFNNVVRDIADKLKTKENSIGNLFEGLDDIIGNVISIVCPVSISVSGSIGHIIDQIVSDTQTETENVVGIIDGVGEGIFHPWCVDVVPIFESTNVVPIVESTITVPIHTVGFQLLFANLSDTNCLIVNN